MIKLQSTIRKTFLPTNKYQEIKYFANVDIDVCSTSVYETIVIDYSTFVFRLDNDTLVCM